MKKFNKFLFLGLIFTLLFSFSPLINGAAPEECNKDCSLCSNSSDCGKSKTGSKFNCDWCQMPGETASKCYQKLETSWPPSPSLSPTQLNRCSALPQMIKYSYDWAISLGGLAAFIVLIFAGFQYLTSAGNPTAMGEAKSRIQSAALGIILLLGSWLILNTINPQLTTLQEIEGIEIKGPGEYTGWGLASLSPCKFAILYSDNDWEGTTKKFEIKDEPETPKEKFKSYVVYRKRDFTSEECTADIIDKETGRQIQECKPNPDADDPTKNVFLEPCNPKFDLDCIKDLSTSPYANYKSGGACIMDLYYQSSWWVIPLPGCGNDDKMGSIGASAVDNIKTYIQNPGDIHCLKLTPIKTTK